MVWYLRYVKTWVLACVLYAVAMSALAFLGVGGAAVGVPDEPFVLALALTTAVLSSLLLVAASVVFSKARSRGVVVSRNLAKDYLSGILTTFFLSTISTVLVSTDAYRYSGFVAKAVLAAMATAAALTTLLALGLAHLAVTLSRCVATE